MERFDRILVGVDLVHCNPLDVSSLGSATATTVATAISLAQASDAELLFFTVFNRTEKALQELDPGDSSWALHTFKEEADQVLDALVERARSQGIAAESQLVLGKPWQEIIREVMMGEHDLVVVATHAFSGIRRLFLGSTTLKLLRHCPCPVWVCKSSISSRGLGLPGEMSHEPHPILLVATDLSPAAESALHYGIMLGQLLDARVHVLHVVEYPLDRLGWTLEHDAQTRHYHEEVLASAEKTLHEQLEFTGYRELGDLQIHLADDVGNPLHRIEQFIAQEHIDLLVLGTAARHGLAGVIVGNTAERLLPSVPCSLLVAKDPAFQSPVRVQAEQVAEM